LKHSWKWLAHSWKYHGWKRGGFFTNVISAKSCMHWNCVLLCPMWALIPIGWVLGSWWWMALNPTNIRHFLEKKNHPNDYMPKFESKWWGQHATTTSFLVLLIEISDVILLNEIFFRHGLPRVDPCPPNRLVFIVYLLHHVPQAQLGPNVVLKNLRHSGSI
jgi:hypothetical protein